MYITKKLLGAWPLWCRIAVSLAGAMVLVAYVTISIGHQKRAEEIGNQLKDRSHQTLKLFSVGALESVISEDIAVLNSMINETIELETDIYSIAVSNASGQQMVSWQNHGQPIPEQAYQFERVIEFEGEIFGKISTVWDPSRLLRKVDERLHNERFYLYVSLLCLTALSLLLLHVLVTRPLSIIDKRLRMLSVDRDDSHNLIPLKLSSSKEISRLANAVNELDGAFTVSKTLAIELKYQADHDYLTSLENRLSFERNLNDRLKNRTDESLEDTLLYFDLDQFKIVNDTCGHAAGDALLIQLAAIIKRQIRPCDCVARVGGDEFAILLQDLPIDDGIKVAERLRMAIESFRFYWHERVFSTEASIGAVAIKGSNILISDILAKSDIACYAAKSSGRNRVHIYQEDDNELNERQSQMSWLPRISAAIENSRLVLFGQIIDTTVPGSSTLSHVEILVRMLDDEDNVIAPGAFLPAAERYGLISQLDRWVISNTLLWMKEQFEQTGPTTMYSINISGASICDEQFRDYLLTTLDNTEVPCENICFEITETVAVANLSIAVNFMNEVKNYGCRFALDDFGTGMSSFTYLKDLPVDYVKIDGAFVRDLVNDETSKAMVKAIGDISRVMKIQAIAEFVENDEIREKLKEMGIDYVQGFGVGKPQSLDNFLSNTLLQAA